MIDHPILVTIIAASPIAEDVRRFELRSASGEALPPFTAGAHIDIDLAEAGIRQYSLLNAPSEADRYVIAVARDPASRGGSIHMHDRLGVGDVIAISAPRCHFALVDDASYSVLVGGGIGITPLWCMAQRLDQIGKPWELHYAARTRGHAALIGEIERAGGRLSTYFNLEGDPLMDLPAIVAAAPPGAHFYCCGPSGLIDAYQAACAGLPADHVHFERFAAAAPAATDGGYEVELVRSRRTITVEPGQSILDALAAAGMRATFSCREGVCGSCETAVVSGIPDHRDAILTDAERAEGKTMMICCSGSLSRRLVLDL